jgi:hypothetical protein
MAEDDLDALGSLAEKATNAVFRLTENPRRGRTKVGVLRGVRALEFSMRTSTGRRSDVTGS